MPFQGEVGVWYYKDSCHHDTKKQKLLDNQWREAKAISNINLEMFISEIYSSSIRFIASLLWAFITVMWHTLKTSCGIYYVKLLKKKFSKLKHSLHLLWLIEYLSLSSLKTGCVSLIFHGVGIRLLCSSSPKELKMKLDTWAGWWWWTCHINWT